VEPRFLLAQPHPIEKRAQRAARQRHRGGFRQQRRIDCPAGGSGQDPVRIRLGKTQFGSGWAWLVSKGGKLVIEKTPNAENPMAKGVNCLLTVDVWEHAYYLDYQNARPKYLEALLGKLLNWDFASQNLTKEDQAVRAAAE
jgi:hypothetical protein